MKGCVVFIQTLIGTKTLANAMFSQDNGWLNVLSYCMRFPSKMTQLPFPAQAPEPQSPDITITWSSSVMMVISASLRAGADRNTSKNKVN
jgi:hypothetical protein